MKKRASCFKYRLPGIAKPGTGSRFGQKSPIMKLKLLFLLAIPFIMSSSFVKPKKGKLTITYTTVGTNEGYSYVSKMNVYIDGTLVSTGPEKDQQQKNSFSLTVPQGSHEIKCLLLALYEGKWEERTVDNDYSFDWKYEGTLELKKKNNLELEFNITENKVVVK